MKSASLSSSEHLSLGGRRIIKKGQSQKGLFKRFDSLETDAIEIVYQDERTVFGNPDNSELGASVEVQDSSFFSDIALGGSVGAAEAYMGGSWECDDLVSLVRILLRNRSVLEAVEGGAAVVSKPLRKVAHWVNRNTREGARRNIAAHYDLGNDFFSLWLDKTMMYSCAVFEHPEVSLHDAQIACLDLVCRKLDLQPDDHIVEIGTGWGGFAMFAVQHYGCRVTTTTISNEQYRLAEQRISEAGLTDRITLLSSDFRDLDGQFDKLVSLEMIEAIGADLYPAYFSKCSELLKPDGLALIQAITMRDQHYDDYRKSIDFIQRYIFPGSALPSSGIMTDTVARNTDMRLLDLQDIGLDYARTLHCWRQNFIEKLDQVRKLGYPEAFIRMWEYYLCYCEAAFLERAISDVHLLLAKPRNFSVVR
jgi:cyclopropane-fatty-acyl-phospholipid synthase